MIIIAHLFHDHSAKEVCESCSVFGDIFWHLAKPGGLLCLDHTSRWTETYYASVSTVFMQRLNFNAGSLQNFVIV